MFTLIEIGKTKGVKPYAYLQHVVGNIARAETGEALDALMQWNMSLGPLEAPDTLICWRLRKK